MIGELVPTLELCLLAAWRTLPLFLLVFVLDRALKNRTPARLSCVL
ncbi:MAG: hypothetical protein O3C60_11645 [Planctomycetota bacterium]|nr:hypothetical protein [Planctomycetota bacterium]